MRIFLFIALSLLLFSCKKDNFKDDYHQLVGRWKWTHTLVTWSTTGGWMGVIDTLYPADYGYNYEVEFHTNGKISFYQNDKLVECWKRNCVHRYTLGTYASYDINHNCNSTESDLFVDLHRPDSLALDCRPLDESHPDFYNSYGRWNYFVREK